VQHTVARVRTWACVGRVLHASLTGLAIYLLSSQMQVGQETDVERMGVVRTDLMV
jgi:hypothetical protein